MICTINVCGLFTKKRKAPDIQVGNSIVMDVQFIDVALIRGTSQKVEVFLIRYSSSILVRPLFKTPREHS